MTFAKSLCAAAFVALVGSANSAHAADGLIEVESPLSASATMDRLVRLVEERGLNVFARIDHAAGAVSVEATLRPTELLIFGSPRGGTPLMACAQTVGIDLPLKALVWEDEQSRVWLGFNDVLFIAERHGVEECPGVANLNEALSALAEAATAP